MNGDNSTSSRRQGSRPPIRLRMPVVGWAMGFVLVVCAGLSPQPAMAHAFLTASSPSPNTVVATAPDSVTMKFTEPLEPTYSKAELFDNEGNVVPDAASHPGNDEYTLVLDLPSDLPTGTYSVLWRTLSNADGHTAQNYFAFTIGTEADVDTSIADIATESGPPLWLQTVARWSAFLGLALSLAIWPIWLFVLRPAISPGWHLGPDLTRRIRRFAVFAISFAVVANVFALLVQSSMLSDQSFVKSVHTTLGDTRYGKLWLLRMGLILLYGLILQWTAWWWPKRTPVTTTLGILVGAALPLPFSLIAHASAQTTGRDASIFSDVVHLLSASIWVGGLVILVVVLAPLLTAANPTTRRDVLARALPRFSTIALSAWIALALTGFYSAWLHVGNINALIHTDYGRTLIVKLAILVPILMLAAFNLFVVTRHLEQSRTSRGNAGSWIKRFSFTLATETILAVAVLAVVGTLTSQAPAREVVANEPTQDTVAFTLEDREATLNISPGATGPNTFDLTFGGDPVSDDTEVLLRLELPAQKTGETEIEMTRDGSSFTHQGSELSIAGDWNFTLIVRPPGAAELRATTTHEITVAGPSGDVPGAAWHFGTIAGIVGILCMAIGTVAIVHIRRSTRVDRRWAIRITGAIVIVVGAIILYAGRVEPSPETNATTEQSAMIQHRNDM